MRWLFTTRIKIICTIDSVPDIGEAVKVLIELKAQYKDAAGEEWKEGCTPPSSGAGNASVGGGEDGGEDAESLNEQISAQRDSVRQLQEIHWSGAEFGTV